ncbi:MAG TPA: PucR family transcriptional regulator [Clostridia bacterium]|nr:PucR family transcriptional regulator [Clostridia bacterium]
MAVTVADLLKLPSLRNAEVVAGRGGLHKIVSSISVLESVDPELLTDAHFPNDEYYGSEIVITSFVNIKDDVELQCRNIRRLAEGGEVGLILYYVGIFMKEIHPRLIELAEELDFTLICMPRNRLDLRYSEVICEVMEAIYRDRSAGGSMVVELLERVSRLPQHQRTVDTVVKMLSDRLRATVILTDAKGTVLNEAAWPRTLSGLHARLKSVQLPSTPGKPAPFPYVPEGLLYRAAIDSDTGTGMDLFLIREGTPLSGGEFQQAVEIVQLAVRLWSQNHDKVVISELVKAIMQDEPMKMRRLADLFQIDVASIHAMWIAVCKDGTGIPTQVAEKASDLARHFCRTSFADVYEGCLVLFMDGPKTLQDIETLKEALLTELPPDALLTTFRNLENTAAVREAYLANRECAADLRKIFPGRNCFSEAELGFVKNCRERIAQGEEAVTEALAPLRVLEGEREARELKHTLAVYLLDTGGSLTATAKKLFLHENTIKYRLKCISDRLGYRVGTMPASAKLYEAVAISRVLEF